MNPRRYLRILAPVVLAAALLAGTVTPAGAAGSSAPPPFTGQCGHGYNWWSDSFSWTVGATPSQYQCGSTFQFEFYCGIYGNPATYYWLHSQTISFTSGQNGNPPISAHYGGDPCPLYSNDIVLNIGIVVWAWTNYYICWNHNAQNWIYLRSDVRCTFN